MKRTIKIMFVLISFSSCLQNNDEIKQRELSNIEMIFDRSLELDYHFLKNNVEVICDLADDIIKNRLPGMVPSLLKDHELDLAFIRINRATPDFDTISLREKIFSRINDTTLLRLILKSDDTLYNQIHYDENIPQSNISNLEFARKRLNTLTR